MVFFLWVKSFHKNVGQKIWSKNFFEKMKPNFLFVDIYNEDLKKREDKRCLMMR